MHNFSSMQTKIFIQFLDAEILRNKTSVLKHVSFTLQKGDFVYLIGPTGSGKSSLLQSISAQLPIPKGSLTVDDIPIHKMDKQAIPYLRRKIGIVSSDFPLSQHLSVEENLSLVLQATDWQQNKSQQARIQEVLELLDIVNYSHKKIPELTKKVQLQVMIARALLNAPSILLLDEPTRHIDATAAQEILTFLFHYSQTQETTVLLATVDHSLTQLLTADKVLLCKDQQVIEQE